MTSPFLRAYPPTEPVMGSTAYWLPFRAGKLIVQEQAERMSLLRGGDEIRALLHSETVIYLGTLNNVACYTCAMSKDMPLAAGWQELSTRALMGRLDTQESALVGYASQMLGWQRNSKYCPVCGHLTEAIPGGWGKRCPDCSYQSYPPVTPAILVLIHDGDRMLLTHKPGWGRRYSCIAGFVEPGESLEECVAREAMEEVGVEVTEITYVTSQPWPYPSQLMVGYFARYAGGEVHADQQELDDARWFQADMLPEELPPPMSLAHQLIMDWIRRQQTTK